MSHSIIVHVYDAQTRKRIAISSPIELTDCEIASEEVDELNEWLSNAIYEHEEGGDL